MLCVLRVVPAGSTQGVEPIAPTGADKALLLGVRPRLRGVDLPRMRPPYG